MKAILNRITRRWSSQDAATAGVGDGRSYPRLNYGVQHDRVFYVFALPKSGSRNFYQALIDMQPQDESVELRTPPVQATNAGWLAAAAEVKPYFLDTVDNALLHSHAAPLPVSLTALILHNVRHLVLIRHPADHLAALYCHFRKLLIEQQMIDDRLPPIQAPDPDYIRRARQHTPRWHPVIHTVNENCFGNHAGVEDGIQHLIEDGYLVAALNWLSDWTRLAAPDLTRIVRYEDVVQDPHAEVEKAYRFLWRSDPATVRSPFAREQETFRSAYPNGHTSGPGIWKKYFSKANIESFDQRVRQWQALNGSVLDPVYPDLSPQV